MKAFILFLVLGVQVVSAQSLECGDVHTTGLQINYLAKENYKVIAVKYYGYKNEMMHANTKFAEFSGHLKSIERGARFSKETFELIGFDEDLNDVSGELIVTRTSLRRRGGRSGEDYSTILKHAELNYEDKKISFSCY
jgi:hypothetical protein